jgi:hypothetical protein
MTPPRRSSKISAKRARLALTQLLFGCTAERLASFTPASLSQSYNVPREEAERMLDRARAGRGV